MTQADYEDINTGSEFMMEFRYCNVLTVLNVTMLYGSGIPILYLIAAIFFTVTYWIDLTFLFYFYRKPVTFDHYLAERSLRWFKYAVFLHLVGGALMFSNSSILPPMSSSMTKKIQTAMGSITFGPAEESLL